MLGQLDLEPVRSSQGFPLPESVMVHLNHRWCSIALVIVLCESGYHQRSAETSILLTELIAAHDRNPLQGVLCKVRVEPF